MFSKTWGRLTAYAIRVNGSYSLGAAVAFVPSERKLSLNVEIGLWYAALDYRA